MPLVTIRLMFRPRESQAEEVPDLGRTMERHYPDPEHRVDEWARRFVTAPGESDTQVMLVDMTAATPGG